MIQLEPGLFEAHYDLGLLHYRNGQLEEAQAAFERALEIEPGRFEALFYRGLILSKRGQGPEALQVLERCHELLPRHAATLYHLGVAYCRADRFADAISTLETTIQLLPDYPRAHYYLGIAYDRAGRLLYDVRLYDSYGKPLDWGAYSANPDRRQVTDAEGQPVFNAFPIRYVEPGTNRVADPEAAPLAPPRLTTPLPVAPTKRP